MRSRVELFVAHCIDNLMNLAWLFKFKVGMNLSQLAVSRSVSILSWQN